jgi:hypothetical protein
MVTFSVKGDVVKLLKHLLEILLQFVQGSDISIINRLHYNAVKYVQTFVIFSLHYFLLYFKYSFWPVY